MYIPASDRYERMSYRYCGHSGLRLPTLALGLWHNFGDDRTLSDQRAILTRAFDAGITHFDLANNYGTPYGSAEANFGTHLARDFRPFRDELVISTKAGWDMWPGPYGGPSSCRKYLLASLDQSLARMGLDYVDIFYSHRPDPFTPLEETIGALKTTVDAGKALYAGISAYNVEMTVRAVELAREYKLPLIVHQPRYSLLDQSITDGLLQKCHELGLGLAVFSPLQQGFLTDRYLTGIPEGSRATHSRFFNREDLTEERVAGLRALNDIAARRGQSLAQMSLAWIAATPEITTILVGASSVRQLEDNLAALDNTDFCADELAAIDAIVQPIRLA